MATAEADVRVNDGGPKERAATTAAEAKTAVPMRCTGHCVRERICGKVARRPERETETDTDGRRWTNRWGGGDTNSESDDRKSLSTLTQQKNGYTTCE